MHPRRSDKEFLLCWRTAAVAPPKLICASSLGKVLLNAIGKAIRCVLAIIFCGRSEERRSERADVGRCVGGLYYKKSAFMEVHSLATSVPAKSIPGAFPVASASKR